ncbi:hypothetical protein EBN03_05010 [Nocardia stercoris]|uniref:Uncharacterized protein n=1 Tax=Nocardia stercoris TaxID=2483361 RepID=A0A3M2LDI4_9NOCA|nr:hypothetical protein EBN03_05010 [Nocardia stercoris]
MLGVIQHLAGRYLESFRRPAFHQLWPFAPDLASRLGDESLTPDTELLDEHHRRLRATIATIDGAGLASDDEDLADMKQHCQQTLDDIETLQSDGSADRVLASAISGGPLSELQQWLLIETITLGAYGSPTVQFTLDRPDVKNRLEIADLRHAISAAREWADEREAELHERETSGEGSQPAG